MWALGVRRAVVYAIAAIVALLAWSVWRNIRADRALRARLASQNVLYEQRDIPATVTAWMAPLSYRSYRTTFDLVVTEHEAVLFRVPAFKAPPIEIRREGAPTRWGELVLVTPAEIVGDAVDLRSDPQRWAKMHVSFTASDPTALRRALETMQRSGFGPFPSPRA